MALTYLTSQMIELPAHIDSISTSSLTSDNINVVNLSAAEFFTDDINFSSAGGSIYNNTNIYGDLTVTGSITALSGLTVVETIVTSTTALSVVNSGAGTAFVVSQTVPNTSSVADFKSNNTSVLKVNNTLPSNGQPGVDIFYPGTGPALRVSSNTNALQVIGRTTTTDLSALSGTVNRLTTTNIVTDTIRANTFNTTSLNTDFNTVTNLSVVNFSVSGVSFQGKSSITAPTNSVANWSWDSTLTGQGDITEIFLKPDGTKLYVCRGNDIRQYTLTAAWNISAVSLDTTFNIPWDSATAGMYFSPDGTKFVTVGTTASAAILPGVAASEDRAWYATLSSAWDLTSTTLVSTIRLNTGVAGQYAAETSPTGITFDSTGGIMYIVGSTLDTVQQFTLTQPYNVGTATFSKVLSVGDQDTVPQSIRFNETGTSLYLLGSTGDDIMEYRLSTPWDVATATFFEKFYIGDRETSPTGLYITGSGINFAYVGGSTTDAVQRYRTNTQAISIKPELTFSNVDIYGNVNFKRLDSSVVGNVLIDKNLRTTGFITVDGALTTGGSITCGGDITVSGNDVLIGSATAAASLFSGITTGNLSLATSITTGTLSAAISQTTGSIVIGGAGGTGNIVIGRSTSASGQNILIGSSGNRVVYGIADVNAEGTDQATATGLNAAINNITTGSGGVRMPTSASTVAGMRLLVRNGLGTSVNIYPVSNGAINALGTNNPFVLSAAQVTELFATSPTQWYTF